jgi:YVTN family beta-propeller protein
MRSRVLVTAAIGIGMLLCSVAPAVELATHLRRPANAALSVDEQYLYVANERSGTLTIIDTARNGVVAERKVGERLVDLVALPQQKRWLALDAGTGQLLRLQIDRADVQVVQRLDVDRTAVRVVLASGGRRAYVAGKWSRRVHVIDIGAETQELQLASAIDLPIAPQELQLAKDDTRLIAGDAFTGRLAVIDTQSKQLLHISEFPAHNIRGLALHGDKLLVAHQMLNELGHTVENDVHWGLVMTNDLRWLVLDTILNNGDNLYRGAHVHPLGEPGRGSGDPAGVAVAANGRVVVALGGTDQVAIGDRSDLKLTRVKVGQRPTRVVTTADSRTAWVLNTHSDSVSRIDLDTKQVETEISLGPTPTLSPVELGETLFYNARLSLDGWMSCHSCHSDGHTNGQKNDNFSDKTFGAPKRVLSLRTTTDSAPFGWRGNSETLEAQVQTSITQTMQGTSPSQEQVAAIAAYLKTLTPPPSIDAARQSIDRAAVERGQTLFGSLKCTNCHAPPSYTTPKLYDVGLKDELDQNTFNPPSLLGVGQRGPYFHDGRAKSLDDVFELHGHQLPRDLSADELRDLVKFLRSL